MRAVDTNVLVRLVVRDDRQQAAAAEAFVAGGAWASHITLAELAWVLAAVYERPASTIADAIDMLLTSQHLVVEAPDVVENAVEDFRRRPAIGFADCLILAQARKAGHVPLGTFDRDLARLDDVELLRASA